MLLLIPCSLWGRLTDEAKKCAPKECCGYLFGERRGDENVLEGIYPMKNIHCMPQKHFAFSPLEQLEVLKTHSSRIIGIYHSHPCSKPIASPEDKAYIYFETYSNLIISLKNGISFASYRKVNKKTLKESIIFLDT